MKKGEFSQRTTVPVHHSTVSGEIERELPHGNNKLGGKGKYFDA